MTIVGHGDIASVLVDHPDRIYFASGVSNSSETRESAYQREKNLLLSHWPTDKKLVYFGSLCIFYAPNTRYAEHKMDMEALVEGFERYAIIRVGNISWGKNPRTLLNNLRIRKAAGLPLEIQDVYRYVVNKSEFLHWLDIIPEDNCVINVWERKMKVSEIVEEFV